MDYNVEFCIHFMGSNRTNDCHPKKNNKINLVLFVLKNLSKINNTCKILMTKFSLILWGLDKRL